MAGLFERRATSGYPRKDASVPAAIEETPGGQTYNFLENEYQQQPQQNIWDRLSRLLRGKGAGEDDDVTVRDMWVQQTGLPDEQMDQAWYMEQMQKLQNQRNRR